MDHRTSKARDTDNHLLGLVGPWILNKGDDLMFRSVLDHFENTRIGAPAHLWPAGVPDGVIPLLRPPSGRQIAQSATRPGHLLRLGAKRIALTLPTGAALGLMGRARADAVTGLLDCSGFGYGDQWTTPRMLRRSAYYSEIKAKGAPIALLPQALGPFETPQMRDAARRLFGLCDVIFARDEDSLRYLGGLELGAEVKLRRAPDITHLLAPTRPGDEAAWGRRICIVPNTRMVDRTPPDRAAAYLDFLVDAATMAQDRNYQPYIVLHEANDRDIVAKLNARFDTPLPVVDEDAPTTKGILACCHAVVASRYHALVSCLSQATPCIGTSWSHKYDRLFEEYEHTRFLISPESESAHRRACLDEIMREPGRAEMKGRLARIAEARKAEVAQMWREVDALFGL